MVPGILNGRGLYIPIFNNVSRYDASKCESVKCFISMPMQNDKIKRSVSAIIAVYNPDPVFFQKAVFSVLDQSYPVKELVLVNDGGTDKFRGYLPDDERIRVFYKQHEGVAATRNFAIDKCTGEYIAFLDQDDFWYQDKLMMQLSLIAEEGEHCMVTSPIAIIDAEGEKIRKDSVLFQKTYLLKAVKDQALLNLIYGNFIYSSTPLIHHAVFNKIGGFDPLTQPHDDWDMYLRVVLAGFPIYFYHDKPLSVWRFHESNESHKRAQMLFSKCKVEYKLLRIVKDEVTQSVVRTNILIDYLERANLLYKNQDYIQFRVLTKNNLFKLLRYKRKFLWNSTALHRDLSRRVRQICLKSARRYVVSLFLS